MESTPKKGRAGTAPGKFFGSPVFKDIKTGDDLIKALESFCSSATHDEILNARQELKQLAAYDREVYKAVIKLIWTLEFPKDSVAFDNRCQLIMSDWF